jgi:structural maintenance of chromosome 2
LLDQVQAELEKEREILSAFDEEIAELQAAVKTKAAQLAETQLEMSKINHEIEKFQRDKIVTQQAVSRMENEHDWILNQKQYVYFTT